MTVNEPRFVWVMYRDPLSMRLHPREIGNYITRREVVKVTAKGMRLKMSDSWDSFHRDDKYHFFNSEAEALLFLKREAEDILDALILSQLKFQHFGQDLQHAIDKAQ